MSLLIYISGLIGGSGGTGGNDEGNNFPEIESLQDFSDYFQSPKSDSSTLASNPTVLNTHNPFKSDSPKFNIYPLPEIKYVDPWDISIISKSYSLPLNTSDPFNQST